MKKIYNIKNAQELEKEREHYYNEKRDKFVFSYSFYFFLDNHIFTKANNEIKTKINISILNIKRMSGAEKFCHVFYGLNFCEDLELKDLSLEEI